MKFNRIVKFIYHLQVFISIQLLIKVAWGPLFGVVFISSSISEVRVVQKLKLVEKGKTILRNVDWLFQNIHPLVRISLWMK
jgi:hypothetical protein